jgi:hypothetical protein
MLLQEDLVQQFGYSLPAPNQPLIQQIFSTAHATDRFSHERADMPLSVLASQVILPDEDLPSIDLNSPKQGTVVVPLQHLKLDTLFADNTAVLKSLQLMENRQQVVKLLGTSYGQTSLKIPYVVPDIPGASELELTLLAEDLSGNRSQRSVRYPLHGNEPPLIAFKTFATYKVGSIYKKVYTEPARLNYGEFWVRSGETFLIESDLSDDAGLDSFVINRLAIDGTVAQEVYRKEYGVTCPTPAVTHDQTRVEIQFD